MKSLATDRLDDIHVHDLPHSDTSALVNSGIDLYQVRTLLGHRSAGVTSVRYSHLANETLKAAAEAGAAKLNVNW